MINFKAIEGDILQSFLSTLKERVKADPSFMSEDTIIQLGTQISDNLSAKADLFEMIKLDDDDELKRKSLDLLQSKEDEQIYAKEKSSQDKQQGQNVSESGEWQKEYQQEQELTQKVSHSYKKVINFHISGIYDQKTHKYIANKDQHRINLSPLIFKSETEEYLLPKMSCILSRGSKQKVLELSEMLYKQCQEKDYSQDEIMLLLDQALDD